MTASDALRKAKAIDPTATQFVVRLFDGFDGVWMDVTDPLSAEAAMKKWDGYTHKGKRSTSYSDIDYYAIYPTTVKMVFSDEGVGRPNAG